MLLQQRMVVKPNFIISVRMDEGPGRFAESLEDFVVGV